MSHGTSTVTLAILLKRWIAPYHEQGKSMLGGKSTEYFFSRISNLRGDSGTPSFYVRATRG